MPFGAFPSTGFRLDSASVPIVADLAMPGPERPRENTLQACGWRINGTGNAAERLGLHPNTLRFRMKKLGIPTRREKRFTDRDARTLPPEASSASKPQPALKAWQPPAGPKRKPATWRHGRAANNGA
jgi:Bacterial regulatory protein, Fis family